MGLTEAEGGVNVGKEENCALSTDVDTYRGRLWCPVRILF